MDWTMVRWSAGESGCWRARSRSCLRRATKSVGSLGSRSLRRMAVLLEGLIGELVIGELVIRVLVIGELSVWE